MHHRKMHLSLLCIHVSLAFAFPGRTPPFATTSAGNVFGHLLPASADTVEVNEFLGIPFANAKRWESPVDFKGHYTGGKFDADMWGRACMQVLTANTTYGAEDCLKANVWQPSRRNESSLSPSSPLLPVLVFVYGGSNQFGEAEPYNMSAIAAFHNTVAVNFNYRTGPIGWMAFEEDAASNTSTGNWGILDIQSALRWVQREIPAFGGDPRRVAIHGQSSGGGLVELQYVARGSDGLFRGAISESGKKNTHTHLCLLSHFLASHAFHTGGLGATPLSDALEQSVQAANKTGCLAHHHNGKPYANKTCMQMLPALNATSLTYSVPGWGPVTDGITFPKDPTQLLREGAVNPGVDGVVLGAQTNDSFLSLSRRYTKKGHSQPNTAPDGYLETLSTPQYIAALRESLGEISLAMFHAVLVLYPPALGIRNVQSLARVASDQMHCSLRQRAGLLSKALGPGSAFVYRFDWWYQSNPQCTAVPNYHGGYLGAIHQDEASPTAL